MSAKNRTKASAAHDRYLTPPRLARAAFDQLQQRYTDELYAVKGVLEPGAGPGTFCRLAQQYCGSLDGLPIGVELHSTVGNAGAYKHIKRNFLKWTPMGDFDLIVSNPPYTYAEEFIRHSASLLAPGGLLFFLMRIGMVGAKVRRDLWKNCVRLEELWMCRPRPTFTSDGHSDATEYAFFLMRRHDDQVRRFEDPRFLWLDWDFDGE